MPVRRQETIEFLNIVWYNSGGKFFAAFEERKSRPMAPLSANGEAIDSSVSEQSRKLAAFLAPKDSGCRGTPANGAGSDGEVFPRLGPIAVIFQTFR